MLQTKTYSIGDFAYGSWSRSYVLDLTITEQSIDAASNLSTIEYLLQLRSGPNNRFSDYINCTLSLNGIVVDSKAVGISAAYNATYVLLSGSTTVLHNADGSLDMPILAKIVEPDGDNKYAPPEMTISEIMTLTSIPMASTIGATDANIESVSMIAVNQKSLNYSHSIQYRFGSASGYITSNGDTSNDEIKFYTTSVPFKVPASFYNQIPNAQTGVCTLVCRTYSGNVQVGNDQTTTFVATASRALCAPEVQGSVYDSNDLTAALTGDRFVLIRYKSNALCTISATARNGASIVGRAIAGVSITENSYTVPGIEGSSILFSATDSRGYSESVLKQFTLIPYVRLTNNAFANRTDPTSGNAVLVLRGDCYTGSFGNASNAITARYEIDGGESVEVPLSISDNRYYAEVLLSGLHYNSKYMIRVTVSDRLSENAMSIELKRGFPVFDWGENDFSFNVPVNLNAAVYDADTRKLTLS